MEDWIERTDSAFLLPLKQKLSSSSKKRALCKNNITHAFKIDSFKSLYFFVTLTLHFISLLFLTAVIVQVPFFRALTLPFELTVATFKLEVL